MNIALLEDDEISRLGLESLLKDKGTLFEFSEGRLFLEKFESYDIDIAFIDLDLEEELLGLEVVSKLSEDGIHCVILTGREEDQIIAQGYELGAKDYLVKPIDEKTLDAVFHRFEIERKLASENSSQELSMIPRELVEQLRAYSFSKQPILLTGESGTGKTVLSKNIYKFLLEVSDKNDTDFPFVSLNCSELNESLIESELFGHKKGSFTGAEEDKIGRIEKANGGVLFLDEIGAIPEIIQKKLLKVLDEKILFRVGENTQREVDFILISATCEPLEEYIDRGEFREDFYHRLSGLNIEVPAFRDLDDKRKNRIIDDILSTFKRKVILTREARTTICDHLWEGNLREMKRFLEKCNSLGIGIIDNDQVVDLLRESNASRYLDKQTDHGEYFSQLVSQVEKVGLPEVMKGLESYMIHHFYNLNDKKARKTINQLKISNNLFYKYIKKN